MSITRRITLALTVAFLTLVPTGAHADGDETSAVYDLRTLKRIANSGASLARDAAGIEVEVAFRKLPKGDAVTLWVVAFNDPEACEGEVPEGFDFRCTESDFDPGTTSLLYGGGAIVGPNKRAGFEAAFPVGDDTNARLGTPGVTNPEGAEIHVIARTHGPASDDLNTRESQLTTFDGGCKGAVDGQPGPNDCTDLQFAFLVAG